MRFSHQIWEPIYHFFLSSYKNSLRSSFCLSIFNQICLKKRAAGWGLELNRLLFIILTFKERKVSFSCSSTIENFFCILLHPKISFVAADASAAAVWDALYMSVDIKKQFVFFSFLFFLLQDGISENLL